MPRVQINSNLIIPDREETLQKKQSYTNGRIKWTKITNMYASLVLVKEPKLKKLLQCHTVASGGTVATTRTSIIRRSMNLPRYLEVSWNGGPPKSMLCTQKMPIYITIHLSIYLFTYQSIYLSISISIFMSISISISISVSVSIYLSICLSVYLSNYLSPSLSQSPSLYLYLYLSISIYLSIPNWACK